VCAVLCVCRECWRIALETQLFALLVLFAFRVHTTAFTTTTTTVTHNNNNNLTALDLLDEAGAIAQLEFHEASDDEDDAVDHDDDENENVPIVDEHTVASIISEWSGIPMGKLETKEMDRLQILEEELGRRVKGQGRAVRGVARAIRRARAGLRDPNRPVASFLFCGPTGTGA